jgi:hypothetical protein
MPNPYHDAKGRFGSKGGGGNGGAYKPGQHAKAVKLAQAGAVQRAKDWAAASAAKGSGAYKPGQHAKAVKLARAGAVKRARAAVHTSKYSTSREVSWLQRAAAKNARGY